MKYSLMSVPFNSVLKTEKPNFMELIKAKFAGINMPDEEITFDVLRRFYAEKGMPFTERTMEFEDFVKLAGDSGYDGVDCMNYNIEKPPEEIKTMLRKYGVTISAYNIVVPFNNAKSVEEIEKLFEKEVRPGLDTAAAVKADSVLLTPTVIFLDAGITREQAFRNIVYGLRLCVDYAQKIGVCIAAEALQCIQVPYCSLGDMIRVFDAVPGMAYVHDTGNMLPSLDSPVEALDVFKDKLIGLHMKELAYTDVPNSNLCTNGKYLKSVPYGTGIASFDKVYDKLAELNFDGWITFEGATLGENAASGAAMDLEYFKGLEKKSYNR